MKFEVPFFFKLFFGFVILVILANLVFLFTSKSVTIGPMGAIETRCVGGYQYTVDSNGIARQTLSEFGKGVPCSK